MAEFVRYEDGEWSYLYHDGKLAVCGDSYYADDYLSNFLGVEHRDLGKIRYNDRSDVPTTLAGIEADIEGLDREAEREIIREQIRVLNDRLGRI